MGFIQAVWMLFHAAYANSLQEALANESVNRCEISFQIVNAGFEVDGKFESVSCDIKFDPESIANSQVVVSVQAGSITTGIALRDQHLKGREYFNVSQYPNIYLRSRSFTKTGKGKYTGEFELSIKGRSYTVMIPFSVTTHKLITRYKGSIRLNRLDYGIGTHSSILENEVSISFEVISTGVSRQ